MAKIVVNGRSYTGDCINIDGGNIIIDGNPLKVFDLKCIK
mgnify:CR=1 FL=1